MAIIGRTSCSLCGFENAHVKRNDGKLPYVHCPDCGAMTHCKSGHQAKLLLAKMRQVDAAPAPAPAAEPEAPPAPVASTPAAPPARPVARGFWAQMGGR